MALVPYQIIGRHALEFIVRVTSKYFEGRIVCEGCDVAHKCSTYVKMAQTCKPSQRCYVDYRSTKDMEELQSEQVGERCQVVYRIPVQAEGFQIGQ